VFGRISGDVSRRELPIAFPPGMGDTLHFQRMQNARYIAKPTRGRFSYLITSYKLTLRFRQRANMENFFILRILTREADRVSRTDRSERKTNASDAAKLAETAVFNGLHMRMRLGSPGPLSLSEADSLALIEILAVAEHSIATWRPDQELPLPP